MESRPGNRQQAWTAEEHEHGDRFLRLSADGVPSLEGTRTTVVEIALDSLAHHWEAVELQRQHPHLMMRQIHASLAAAWQRSRRAFTGMVYAQRQWG